MTRAMFVLVLGLLLLLPLSSCGVASDDPPELQAETGICDPETLTGLVVGIIWLEEDIDQASVDWISDELARSPFVDRFRLVERAADDAEVGRLVGDESAEGSLADEQRSLFVVRLHPLSNEGVAAAVFSEWDVYRGVSEAVADPVNC